MMLKIALASLGAYLYMKNDVKEDDTLFARLLVGFDVEIHQSEE